MEKRGHQTFLNIVATGRYMDQGNSQLEYISSSKYEFAILFTV